MQINSTIIMTKLIAIFGILFLLNLVIVCWSDGIVSFDLTWKYENGEKLENICPNNHTKCNDKQTCCKTKHNSYHCCRYPHAVCCPDKFHCCPHGTTCDTEKKRCSRQTNTPNKYIETTPEPMEMPVVEQSVEIKTNDQTCPNNRTKCKDSQTCCVTKHGSYHCCKFENAVCCSDKFHCCPEDSTCDIKRHRCVKSNNKMKKLVPAFALLENKNTESLLDETKFKDEITCPNNKTSCKDTKTCCITKHNNYYCCPHKNAVCCSDKYQCCPEGTTCDVQNKKCIKPSFVVNSYKNEENSMQSLQPAVTELNNFLLEFLKLDKKCSDNKFSCPGKKPCCVMAGGKFGCCTLNKGVCCPDLKSCCPHETVCDMTNKKCVADQSALRPAAYN